MRFLHFNYLLQSLSESRLLLSTCASLYSSHVKQMSDLDELEQQANVTLPTGNHRTLPQKTKNRETARKWQKRVWVWCLRLLVLSLSNYSESDPYSIS